MHRSLASLVLLASALPACLLYTDPINKAPSVKIEPPSTIAAGTLTFRADSSDPNGDSLTLLWSVAHKKCAEATAGDWSAAKSQNDGEPFDVEVSGHESFCVRVVAKDRYGATAEKTYDGALGNRAPEVKLDVLPALTDSKAYPLFTAFRITAAPLEDEDGDPVTFTWKGTDAGGADLQLVACEKDHPEVRCFSGDTPGTYTITVQGSDGVAGGHPGTATLPLTVMKDRAPCIEASDPPLTTDLVVMAVSDPPRRFEVRQVSDDGNPFPAGPHGVTNFLWSIEPEGGDWQRYTGSDRPTFDVGASLFDDVRPGSVVKVRVEVRNDPADAHAECDEMKSNVCRIPDLCARWVYWKVKFR